MNLCWEQLLSFRVRSRHPRQRQHFPGYIPGILTKQQLTFQVRCPPSTQQQLTLWVCFLPFSQQQVIFRVRFQPPSQYQLFLGGVIPAFLSTTAYLLGSIPRHPHNRRIDIFFLRSRFPPLPWDFLLYCTTQWSCSASGSLREMPDSNPGPPEVFWITTSPKTTLGYLLWVWFPAFLRAEGCYLRCSIPAIFTTEGNLLGSIRFSFIVNYQYLKVIIIQWWNY